MKWNWPGGNEQLGQQGFNSIKNWNISWDDDDDDDDGCDNNGIMNDNTHDTGILPCFFAMNGNKKIISKIIHFLQTTTG